MSGFGRRLTLGGASWGESLCLVLEGLALAWGWQMPRAIITAPPFLSISYVMGTV